ncbi:Transcriptional regulator, contains XRE-family HTH domain [Psychrobacillus psychrotolerans]|uniref:Transcriptional regulator, contains XRE-family HTH domain n=1 Tax=Psychrobacillus psychrotolerans TaxID=126156 RepID=A0A1I5XZK6_9BACI|nr:helix-turn-helix transcriptional regulator [Psychrobacillus psychrotolerans]SFQ37334.1 Transcriptional regulator, contains XRE-family HTH domain [Psychrobacillus psychrotolerans]
MIGERLQVLRGTKTQEEVAGFLKITRASYAHYEKNRREPNISILIKISDYYGVTIDYLVKGENKKDICFDENDYNKDWIKFLESIVKCTDEEKKKLMNFWRSLN